jgi:hypothetical protein
MERGEEAVEIERLDTSTTIASASVKPSSAPSR